MRSQSKINLSFGQAGTCFSFLTTLFLFPVGSLTCLASLAAYGADFDQVDLKNKLENNNGGNTPLHYAAMGQGMCCRFLVQRGKSLAELISVTFLWMSIMFSVLESSKRTHTSESFPSSIAFLYKPNPSKLQVRLII